MLGQGAWCIGRILLSEEVGKMSWLDYWNYRIGYQVKGRYTTNLYLISFWDKYYIRGNKGGGVGQWGGGIRGQVYNWLFQFRKFNIIVNENAHCLSVSWISCPDCIYTSHYYVNTHFHNFSPKLTIISSALASPPSLVNVLFYFDHILLQYSLGCWSKKLSLENGKMFIYPGQGLKGWGRKDGKDWRRRKV